MEAFDVRNRFPPELQAYLNGLRRLHSLEICGDRKGRFYLQSPQGELPFTLPALPTDPYWHQAAVLLILQGIITSLIVDTDCVRITSVTRRSDDAQLPEFKAVLAGEVADDDELENELAVPWKITCVIL